MKNWPSFRSYKTKTDCLKLEVAAIVLMVIIWKCVCRYLIHYFFIFWSTQNGLVKSKCSFYNTNVKHTSKNGRIRRAFRFTKVCEKKFETYHDISYLFKLSNSANDWEIQSFFRFIQSFSSVWLNNFFLSQHILFHPL